MRTLFRVVLASAVLAATMFATVGPVAAGETITVSCSNGFQRTVAAHAARGVAKSLTKFNAYTHSGVACAAAPGAPRPAAATSWLTISCTERLREDRQREGSWRHYPSAERLQYEEPYRSHLLGCLALVEPPLNGSGLRVRPISVSKRAESPNDELGPAAAAGAADQAAASSSSRRSHCSIAPSTMPVARASSTASTESKSPLARPSSWLRDPRTRKARLRLPGRPPRRRT